MQFLNPLALCLPQHRQAKSLYRREVSPVEQDTIDYEHLAHFEPKIFKKKFIKKILCNFLVQPQQYIFQFSIFFDTENMKKPSSKVAGNGPHIIFFQQCQPVQNQPKSHFLFRKNVSLRDFYIMTLQAGKSFVSWYSSN